MPASVDDVLSGSVRAISAVAGVHAVFGETAVRTRLAALDRWTLVARRGGGSEPAVQRVLAAAGAAPSSAVEIPPGLLNLASIESCMQARDPEMTIVACGGGAVLDAGKLVRRLAVSRPARSLICLPTTCGSGAELTATASVWDGGCKRALSGPDLKPDLALYWPGLAGRIWRPAAVAAYWDALSHACESVWSVQRTPESLALAEAALIKLARDRPRPAAEMEASGVQQGAALAGAAIAITSTGLAHALSYPFTAVRNCPHGLAVGFWTAVMAGPVYDDDAVFRRALGQSLGAPEHLAGLWRASGARAFAAYVSAADIRTIDVDALDPSRARLSRFPWQAGWPAGLKARALALLQAAS